jgi:branched-chain amino acid transport system ATP-binding protein
VAGAAIGGQTDTAGEALLEVQGLQVRYGPVEAVRGVSFRVRKGEIVTLIGANGAGKSSTLAAIYGLVRSSGGTVRVAGEDVTRLRTTALMDRGMALVPEGRAILAQMSVLENLRMGGYRRRDGAALEADIQRMLERFPILGQRRDQVAGSLSGGEQQQLAIARGLLAQPRLLLLDEPSMGLAPLLVDQIFRILAEIHAEGRTILLVEQNARKALALAGYAYVMETGRITLHGTGADLAGNEAVTAAYLGGASRE